MYRIRFILCCCLWLLECVGYVQAMTHHPAIKGKEQVITGIVRDKESRKRLENVTVALAGSSIGTVTNADGVFSLTVPEDTESAQLKLSHVSYLNAYLTVTASDDKRHHPITIWMTPFTKELHEIVIFGGDAKHIVEEALKKIPVNYASTENMLSAFYRETIQKRSRYITISEAMMEVYKTPYTQRAIDYDKVQLNKARHLLSQRQNDTLAVKVAGGPNLALLLDFVKNPDLLFDRETIHFYHFEQESPVLLDDRIQYVIRFTPCVHPEYALFTGKLYIDKERISFTRAEFNLDLSDREKAVASILQKKPAGLRFRPMEVSFLITYRQQNGTSCLHYICNEMRFKCDWKRRLFSSSFTARSEMVVVQRDEHPDHSISRKDAFKSKQIFYDAVSTYWNEDFWKGYNIIEPTESLENAVKRLRKLHH